MADKFLLADLNADDDAAAKERSDAFLYSGARRLASVVELL